MMNMPIELVPSWIHLPTHIPSLHFLASCAPIQIHHRDPLRIQAVLRDLTRVRPCLYAVKQNCQGLVFPTEALKDIH